MPLQPGLKRATSGLKDHNNNYRATAAPKTCEFYQIYLMCNRISAVEVFVK